MIQIDPSRVVAGLIGYFANAFDNHVAQHAISTQHPTTKLLARMEMSRRRPLLLGAAIMAVVVAAAPDQARAELAIGGITPASSSFTCNCQIHCTDVSGPGYAGYYGAYQATSESAAMSMCVADATDRCLKAGGMPGSFYRGRCR